MTYAQTWDKNFNWFDKKHYECHEMVAKSRQSLLNAFHELFLTEYPHYEFGSVLRNITLREGLWYADVERFKTPDLCKKHCEFPSTYVRTGMVLS